MYTYERLFKLCKEESTDGDIARYLLRNIRSLNHLRLHQVVEKAGVSKASIHRFFSKGGYESFKELTSILAGEIRQLERQRLNYQHYRLQLFQMLDTLTFDQEQLCFFLDSLSQANTVAFYGNSREISCLKKLCLFLFSRQKDVHILDQWDLKQSYQLLQSMQKNDLFVIVDTAWHIQGIYENSLNNHYILHLETIDRYPIQKFFIGEANCSQYLSFHNIRVSFQNEDFSYLV